MCLDKTGAPVNVIKCRRHKTESKCQPLSSNKRIFFISFLMLVAKIVGKTTFILIQTFNVIKFKSNCGSHTNCFNQKQQQCHFRNADLATQCCRQHRGISPVQRYSLVGIVVQNSGFGSSQFFKTQNIFCTYSVRSTVSSQALSIFLEDLPRQLDTCHLRSALCGNIQKKKKRKKTRTDAQRHWSSLQVWKEQFQRGRRA